MFRATQWSVSLMTVLAALSAAVSSAEIVSTSFDEDIVSLDLTAAGTKDWAVFGSIRPSESGGSLGAVDFKKGGAGIAKELIASGLTNAFGGDGFEGTQWSGGSWGWSDGTLRASFMHHHGTTTKAGMRIEFDKSGCVGFEFAGPEEGKTHVACLLLRRDQLIEIVALQGNKSRSVHTNRGKSVGLAVVKYRGNEPLRIELRTNEKRAVARGFAAALADASDFSDKPGAIPTLQSLAMRKAEKLEDVDYLKVATEFADCMLKYGRDRYGKVHSPLFAVLLTRESKPRIGPYPLFKSPSPYKTSNMKTPFREFDYNCVLNYPGSLGAEGPHKVTFYGCDPYEDSALYEMLIDLSRITGNAEYKQEAEKALIWWFTNTQGPAGLYPWGEHLGWDFGHECPTYFEGLSKHLYAACYHEIKDRAPFLDILSRVPAQVPGDHTPLEKYALGVWKAHYWDPEHAVYCRHGDYTGEDNREGSFDGFPAHQGAHLRLWVATYLNTRNPDVREEMERILNKVLDVQIARTKKYGFVPFTFDPDYKGKAPGDSPPEQSIRLANHAAELSIALSEAKAAPEIAAKLKQLAVLHLGPEGFEKAAVPEGRDPQIPKSEPRVKDLSQSQKPDDYANEILRNIEYYKGYGDDAYLEAADTYARLAYITFCDDVCPLPKAYAGSSPMTTQGEPFPDFYFHGAKLMHAFALLGEAN